MCRAVLTIGEVTVSMTTLAATQLGVMISNVFWRRRLGIFWALMRKLVRNWESFGHTVAPSTSTDVAWKPGDETERGTWGGSQWPSRRQMWEGRLYFCNCFCKMVKLEDFVFISTSLMANFEFELLVTLAVTQSIYYRLDIALTDPLFPSSECKAACTTANVASACVNCEHNLIE